jgi:hypothetical protein
MNTEQFNNALAWVSAKASEGYKLCHYILSFGSTYLIYNYVIGKGVDAGYSVYLVYVLAFALANLWYRAIEHTLTVIMPFAVAWIMTGSATAKEMSRTARVAARSSVLAVLIMLAATAALSFAINPQISETMNEREDSGREIATNAATLSSYDKDVEIKRSELASARDRDAQIKTDAEKKAAELLNSAIYSQGNEMARLYNAGHQWAAGELSGAIKKAKLNGARIITAAGKARKESPTLQADLNDYMKRSGAARDTVATMTLAVLTSRENAYVSKVGQTNTILWLVVGFVFIIYIFLAFLMVNARLERGEDIIDDDSPGAMKVAKTAALNFNKKWGQKLADKWDVKFVSVVPAPALAMAGNVSAHVESQPRKLAEKSLPSDFQHIKSESAPEEVRESQGKVSAIVSAPPPPGFAIPPKVSASFWAEDAIAYRKRVYGWWATANNAGKPSSTKEDNRTKSEDAFNWFETHGCTVTKKEGGKVSIKFPKG